MIPSSQVCDEISSSRPIYAMSQIKINAQKYSMLLKSWTPCFFLLKFRLLYWHLWILFENGFESNCNNDWAHIIGLGFK